MQRTCKAIPESRTCMQRSNWIPFKDMQSNPKVEDIPARYLKKNEKIPFFKWQAMEAVFQTIGCLF